MAVRIGPINAKFKGKLQLSDIVALESYKINFEGQGGVAGFGTGSAAVTLSPVDTDGQATTLTSAADQQVGRRGAAGPARGAAAVPLSPVDTDGRATTLKYVADAQVGGKIAQIGSRLVE